MSSNQLYEIIYSFVFSCLVTACKLSQPSITSQEFEEEELGTIQDAYVPLNNLEKKKLKKIRIKNQEKIEDRFNSVPNLKFLIGQVQSCQKGDYNEARPHFSFFDHIELDAKGMQ